MALNKKFVPSCSVLCIKLYNHIWICYERQNLLLHSIRGRRLSNEVLMVRFTLDNSEMFDSEIYRQMSDTSNKAKHEYVNSKCNAVTIQHPCLVGPHNGFLKTNFSLVQSNQWNVDDQWIQYKLREVTSLKVQVLVLRWVMLLKMVYKILQAWDYEA